MRVFLKKHLPSVHDLFKNAYHNSFIYKRNSKITEERHKEWVKVRSSEDLKVVEKVFNNEFFVHNGPFEGLKYQAPSSSCAFLPKIMGSYEEPIHEWIEYVINHGYKTIVNVGCAEGYYTTGFALKIMGATILAYDTDSDALKNAKELARLNDIHNIEFKSECTHAELNLLCKENTLVFCDIEGFENTLLDPAKAPNLKKADIIVECHDFIIQGVTENLVKRFIKTHHIKIVVDYADRIKTYQTPANSSKDQFDRIVNEYRQPDTKYMFLKSF